MFFKRNMQTKRNKVQKWSTERPRNKETLRIDHKYACTQYQQQWKEEEQEVKTGGNIENEYTNHPHLRMHTRAARQKKLEFLLNRLFEVEKRAESWVVYLVRTENSIKSTAQLQKMKQNFFLPVWKYTCLQPR